MSATIRMIQEALQAPAVVAKQFQANEEIWEDLCRRLKKIEIPYVLTVARGSSDHAATFAKYLFETQLGLTTASAAPSVVTLYQSRQKLKNCLVLALSQSGESPDICEVLPRRGSRELLRWLWSTGSLLNWPKLPSMFYPCGPAKSNR